MACRESQRRCFTTKENEEIIHLASEDRRQRLELRIRGRQDKSVESHFSEEVEKAEEELKGFQGKIVMEI